jgi:hypothetical protein
MRRATGSEVAGFDAAVLGWREQRCRAGFGAAGEQTEAAELVRPEYGSSDGQRACEQRQRRADLSVGLVSTVSGGTEHEIDFVSGAALIVIMIDD